MLVRLIFFGLAIFVRSHEHVDPAVGIGPFGNASGGDSLFFPIIMLLSNSTLAGGNGEILALS
jgi:hypothetical protein